MPTKLLFQGELFDTEIIKIKAGYMEIKVQDPSPFKSGEYVVIFDGAARYDLRVLKIKDQFLHLFDSQSDLFLIKPNADQHEQRQFHRFPIKSEGIVNDGYSVAVVQLFDISRSGIGFYSNTQLKLDVMYNTVIICGDTRIHPKIQIRHGGLGDDSYRYGAQFISIKEEDLQVLRYFIVQQQLDLS